METVHKIFFNSSSDMNNVPSESVNLVVTSPPYPMIEMWDDIFSSMNPSIRNALNSCDGSGACKLMNQELNKVWKEVDRVMAPGGIVCINIGDATRKLGDSFQLYSNHSKIINYFEKLNYQSIPIILWRKQTNKPNKFMGSGMLPPSAYVTLEHEYILIFRKGINRKFSNVDKTNRRNSAYFWEERNVWFSDIWMDLKGRSQKMNHKELRDRSGAYPFELPYRLINMYSVIGDTILDPFLGTGTTTIASICLGRNSIGYEVEKNFKSLIEMKINEIKKYGNEIIKDRVLAHIKFINNREKSKEIKHKSNFYNIKVVTGQERDILFPIIKDVNQINDNHYQVLLDENISIIDIIQKEDLFYY